MAVEVPVRNERITKRPPATIVGLIAFLAILAVGCVQGGVTMLVDPLEPFGMSAELLAPTPVDTYFLPGLFLLAVAGAALVTVAGLLTGWRWAWANRIEEAVGHRWPWLGAIATGATIGVFEVIELFVVPFHPVMHPLLIAMSVVIVALPFTPTARTHLRVEAPGGAH